MCWVLAVRCSVDNNGGCGIGVGDGGGGGGDSNNISGGMVMINYDRIKNV